MPILRSTRRRGIRTEEPVIQKNPRKKYNIDPVRPARPVNIVLPKLEDQNPTDPNKINPNSFTAPAPVVAPVNTSDSAIQEANNPNDFVNGLNTKKTELENEIENLSSSLANLPQATLDARKKLGIDQDQQTLSSLRETLSGVKQDLLTAQDKQVEITEQGKQRISNFAGTDRDLGQLTNADLRKNNLDQLALSRTFSRLGDATNNLQASINDNITLINNKVDAERAKVEFDITQRNKVLDRVIQAQGSIISNEQKARLEAVKFNNSVKLEREKSRLKNLSENASILAKAGATSDIMSRFVNTDDPDERVSLAGELYASGDLAAKDWLKTITDSDKEKYNRQLELDEKREKVATKNASSNLVISTSEEILSSVNTLVSAIEDESIENVLGRLDQFNNFTRSDNDKKLFAALDNLFSNKTVEALSKMKGNPSDKDMEVVEKSAKGGFNRAIGDPETLRGIVFEMRDKLLESQKIEQAAIDRRNESVGIVPESTSEVDAILEEEEAISASVDIDKIAKVESGGSYTAVNPTSGAYGKYQFIPSTLNQYASRLGMTEQQAKTPQGQEEMFKAFTADNIKGMEKSGIPVNTATVYLAHQQGLGGAKQILSGNISTGVRRNLLSNLPSQYKNGTDEQVIDGWMNTFLPKLA